MPDTDLAGGPEVPRNLIDKGSQSQEKGVKLAAEKAGYLPHKGALTY